MYRSSVSEIMKVDSKHGFSRQLNTDLHHVLSGRIQMLVHGFSPCKWDGSQQMSCQMLVTSASHPCTSSSMLKRLTEGWQHRSLDKTFVGIGL
ncbi:hypothetical protein Dimus_021540 [Dionaea muscipula]